MLVTLNGSGAVDNVVFSRCGNGIRERGEICDGADADACADGCNAECACDRNPICGDGIVDAGEQCDEGAANSDTEPGRCRSDCTRPRCGDGVIDSGEECDDGNRIDGDGCSATCEHEDREQPEGCTPGYWKQRHHHDSWVGAMPYDLFNTTFGVDRSWNAKRCSSSDPNLAQALGCRGGGVNALARHGVAALLNSMNAQVNYGLTRDEVLYMVREALMSHDRIRIEEAKNLLAGLNENGCPLN
jgi:cysteine-rich repeat protein